MQHSQSKMPSTSYNSSWTALVWLEIVIKFVGITIGMIAGALTLANFAFIVPESIARFSQAVILLLLALGLVAGIVHQYMEREIRPVFFVILNALAHWGIVIALVSANLASLFLVLFCLSMILGDLVKLRLMGMREVKNTLGLPRAFLYALPLLYILGYGLIIVLTFL